MTEHDPLRGSSSSGDEPSPAPPAGAPPARDEDPTATIPPAADPPDEPPATRARSWGLWVGPKAEFSVELPMANSSRLVLPMTMAPAAVSRSTTVAS